MRLEYKLGQQRRGEETHAADDVGDGAVSGGESGGHSHSRWLMRCLCVSFVPLPARDDLIAVARMLPPKNLTICAVSVTSLGGFQMSAYEFLKRNFTVQSMFNVLFMNTHAASLEGAINGTCDFATARTGTLDVAVNDSTIDVGTFTVLTNINRTYAPTPFFPQFLSTPLYPEWPVLAMPWVPEALVQAFTVPLTALSILTNTPEATRTVVPRSPSPSAMSQWPS